MDGQSRSTKAPFVAVEDVSALLNEFLDGLSLILPREADRGGHQLPLDLEGRREQLSSLDAEWRAQSLRIAALRMSLSLAEKKKKDIQVERQLALHEANELVLQNNRTIHLPFEILCHICSFAYPEPIDLVRIRDFRHDPWGKIVLQTALFTIRFGQIGDHTVDDIADLLPVSPTAKLSIEARGFYRRNEALLRMALRFHRRWHELSMHSIDSEAACRMFREASQSKHRCADNNDSKSIDVPFSEPMDCEFVPSSVLSHIKSLSINTNHIACLSGLLPAVTQLSLSVQINATFRTDLALALKEVPSLTNLSIKWHSSVLPSYQVRSVSSLGRRVVKMSPNLKCLTLKFFIYPRLDEIKYIVDILDGDPVRELHVHCLGISYAGSWADCKLLDFLGTKFPRLVHLGVRKQYMPSSHHPVAFRAQAAMLTKMSKVDVTRGTPLFPMLHHLSVEFDGSEEGLQTLKDFLQCRYKGDSVATVSSVTLHDVPQSFRDNDRLDYFNELQLYVNSLFVLVKC